MGKNWHYLFLVLAFLFVLFPPVVSPAPSMQMSTKFVFLFSAVPYLGTPMPYNWPVLFSLEAVCLTAFAVFAAQRRGS
ncbi:MAG TPA: hypothetical protein VHE55_01805 [Fimbriimonadaceae bacterium]|nr:hypothetical protein [Fimbriimonadaceae bacterium]